MRGRTGRHLTPGTTRRWNIDWLKPLATPVAVWWTHDRRRVEFAWAGLLAGLPGATCPAPRFGGNDNRAAEAHLFRFDAPPPVAAFRRRVHRGLPGHAPVHAMTVEGWAGAGWPG